MDFSASGKMGHLNVTIDEPEVSAKTDVLMFRTFVDSNRYFHEN